MLVNCWFCPSPQPECTTSGLCRHRHRSWPKLSICNYHDLSWRLVILEAGQDAKAEINRAIGLMRILDRWFPLYLANGQIIKHTFCLLRLNRNIKIWETPPNRRTYIWLRHQRQQSQRHNQVKPGNRCDPLNHAFMMADTSPMSKPCQQN